MGGKRREREGSPDSLERYARQATLRGGATDAVADALREAILDGVLRPGTWLREIEVARDLSVSRTPVREALRRLNDEGLVVKSAYHGTVVAPLSVEDVLALYVVRAHLEGLAARLAAQRRSPSLVNELQRILDEMRAKKDQPEQLPALNLEFHRVLRKDTGNSYLQRFLTQVEYAVRRSAASTLFIEGRPDTAIAEHQLIVDRIAEGDVGGAEKAAQIHIQNARELRLRQLLDG